MKQGFKACVCAVVLCAELFAAGALSAYAAQEQPLPDSGMTLDTAELTLDITEGDPAPVAYLNVQAPNDYFFLIWTSSDPAVASVDGTGKVTTPTDTRTKRQKGKDYPLAEVSGLKKGWAEQADAFGDWLKGKTPDEVKKLKTDADGKPTDADLLSGCTIAVDRYRDAIVRACENAQVLGAARGDTVKLGVEVAEMPQGLTGTDDKDAQVQAKITLAVVTMDENARVTSAIGDMTEPELTVSADGTVSAPREPVYTKNELGDRYGMRSASALGKEWYEHSAGWCGYLKGKNAVEIGKLSADGTDADLKALCTISVTDLQKAALKAMAEQ